MAKNRVFFKNQFSNVKTGENQNRIILAKSRKGPASFGEIRSLRDDYHVSLNFVDGPFPQVFAGLNQNFRFSHTYPHEAINRANYLEINL